MRGQSAEMLAAFRSLVFALLLATFLVYLVLASQFESFVQPLIILFAIPLGMSGVVLALWLTGQSLNVLVKQFVDSLGVPIRHNAGVSHPIISQFSFSPYFLY